ncbi:hypothetical protein A3I45_01350 [Candidatus Uhrbacteria bacterium RIFCSPLOWO2_02_FULL_53_10]|uniref:Glycerophosphoryl diester phosphodiesterase membrane domain-containing protein n=1 Tax=Candidatus Uhrbacteria bacterium RIFCSPLOWO2_02_FULL_53_10 TaxID=1802411 RepID=A0A1F7VGG1_9BACT|nr:MAG: hypothetical protein A3I45_01350 [Candidatus Uhrbacteria bacterium RIFCSPLOWO2_02_FULL_53_10]
MSLIGIGALIDLSWEHYRKHFANNIRITAWLGVFIILHIIAASFYPIGAQELDRSLTGSEWFGIALFLINTIIVLPIVSIWMVNALIRRIDVDVRGKSMTMHKLATEAWQLFFPQLWVRILTALAFGIAFAIPLMLLSVSSQFLSQVLPFGVSMLLMFIGLLLFLVPIVLMIYLAFVYFAFVLNKARGLNALKASVACVRGHFWPITWRLVLPKLLYFGILLAVQYVLLMLLGVFVGAAASDGNTLLAVRIDWIVQPMIYMILIIFAYPMLFITDYHIYRSLATPITMSPTLTHKRSDLGWISVVVAFVFPPVGAVVAIVLAGIALSKKNHDNTIATVGLIYGVAMMIALVVLPILLSKVIIK